MLISKGRVRFSIKPLIIIKLARPNTSKLAPICSDDRPISQRMTPPSRQIKITIDIEFALDPASSISKTKSGIELLIKCPRSMCKKCIVTIPMSPLSCLGISPRRSSGKKRSTAKIIQISTIKPKIQPNSVLMVCWLARFEFKII